MPTEHTLALHQADQARGDFSAIQDDLEFLKIQIARLPTRNDVWQAATWGMLGGTVAAVTIWLRPMNAGKFETNPTWERMLRRI